MSQIGNGLPEMSEKITLTEEQQEEYDSYIENYDAYYDDGVHLEPQAYFEAMAEIQAILKMFDLAYHNGLTDMEALNQRYDARLRQLERMLAV